MKKYNVNLKLSKGQKIEDLVKVFERDNPIVQSLLSIKRSINKIFVLGLICIPIQIFIQKYFYIISILIGIFYSIFIVASIYKKAAEISYVYSKDFGGKRAKYTFRKEHGALQTLSYNLTLMKKKEWKLLNKILKVNHLNNVSCVEELLKYFSKVEAPKKNEMSKFLTNAFNIFLLPTIATIISIYTIISTSFSFEQNIINISCIILGAIIVFFIIIPIYSFYSLKKLSITNHYTYPKLKTLLTEILLNEKSKEVLF